VSQILIYLEIVISILLSVSILLQQRGSGLSGAFGGDLSGFHTKRGIEKFLFIASSVLGFLFIANAFVIAALSA